MASKIRQIEPSDLDACMKLAKKAGYKETDRPDGFLNLLYERDGEIFAWISARVRDSKVLIAPLVVSKKMKPRALFRLLDTGERWLTILGYPGYMFSVHVRRKKWRDFLERIGVYQKISAHGPFVWYGRKFS